MRAALATVAAVLMVILSMGAALWFLTGDFLGAFVYTVLAVLAGILLWRTTEHEEGI